jgi:hypothetical protein
MDVATSALVALLRELDYRARFRRRGWTEVLVSSGDERWVGRGVDKRDALEDALAKMLPSNLARELMARGLAAAPTARLPDMDLERRLEIDIEALEGPLRGVVDAPRDEIDELDAPAPLESVEPSRLSGPVAVEPVSPSSTPSAPDARQPVAEKARPEAAADARPAPVVEPARSKQELLEELEALEQQIDHYLPALPAAAPVRQRLKLTEWIASARQLQDDARRDAKVEKRVARLAARLGAAGKVGWPGGVHALRLDCVPAEADFPPGHEPERPASSWAEVAAHARASLESILASAAQRKEDEEGWRDAPALEPAPPDGATRMARVKQELARLTGPLETSAHAARHEKLEEPPRPSRAQMDELREVVEEHARSLRWLRGGEHDAWGACMGRLRWLVDRHGRELPKGLATLLEPEHAPRGSWAGACGWDRKKHEAKKNKNKLLKSLASTPKGHALAVWLQQALGLGDVLPSPKLATVLSSRRADFLALGPELKGQRVDLGRSPRTRWKKLHDELATQVDALAAPVPAAQARPPVDKDEIEEHEAEPRSWPGALLAKVKGKRVLWIGNRNDQELRKRLLTEFEFASIEIVLLNPKRLDSAAERLKKEGVDLVLACTGFISHSAEGKLRRAAGERVWFVRVEKGRVGAVGRNLSRALGVKAA